jgi:hypothetical protein
VAHDLDQPGVRPGGGDQDQGLIDLGQVHVLRGGADELLGPGGVGDDRGLGGGHRTTGERRRDRGQLLQRPPGGDQLGGGRRGVPGVPAQPGGHRLQPVVLGGAHPVGLPHRAGELGGQPVGRADQRAHPRQQLRSERPAQVLGGAGVDRGDQLLHRIHPRPPP